MMAPPRILVIDDDPDVGQLVFDAAQSMGLECLCTTSGDQGLQLYSPDMSLIFLDLVMPQMDGVEVLRHFGALQCRSSIILMSGINRRVMETAEKLARALGLTIVGHLEKPFRLTELEEILSKNAAHRPSVRVKLSPQIEIPDDEIREGIKRKEMFLYYQPQIDIATGEVFGMEALARWKSPTRGLVFPDSFIGRAEAIGVIDELGWQMLDRGLSELRQFAGPDGTLPRLSINVSVHSLKDLRFPDTLLALAESHHVPIDRIMVEITESVLINELSSALDVVTRLRMKNVQLSIDDFGTGYAMMQQLVNIPATELKIDRIFVMNMQTNDSDRVMVQKTIEIGHELGMKVTAEGVETADHLEFLRSKGCDSAQGYLFSRPLPPQDLIAWLNKYRSTHA